MWRALSQIHREWEVLRHHDVRDIESSGGFVRVGGWCVRYRDQTGVLIGIIM